jgi:hypothetical protein
MVTAEVNRLKLFDYHTPEDFFAQPLLHHLKFPFDFSVTFLRLHDGFGRHRV